MPELPEVESARRLIENNCIGKIITDVISIEQGGGPRDGLFDDIICVTKAEHDISTSFEPSQNDYVNALKNRTLLSIHRKGKQIWMQLSGEGPSVLFHFGMTGAFIVKDLNHATYRSFRIHDEEWPPKFTKFEIIFDDKTHIAFCDPRRLGRIRLRFSDPTKSPPISKLARDPIVEGLPSQYLEDSLKKYSSSIKAVLLDQEKVLSGIGNWVADEVLYQSDIHPSLAANTLTTPQISKLCEVILYVLQTAIDLDARNELFPSDWLFHYRWSKRNGAKQSPLKMPNGDKIIFETHGGRTSAIVVSDSKKPNKSKNNIITTTTNSIGIDLSTVLKQEQTEIDDKTIDLIEHKSIEIISDSIQVEADYIKSSQSSKRSRKTKNMIENNISANTIDNITSSSNNSKRKRIKKDLLLSSSDNSINNDNITKNISKSVIQSKQQKTTLQIKVKRSRQKDIATLKKLDALSKGNEIIANTRKKRK